MIFSVGLPAQRVVGLEPHILSLHLKRPLGFGISRNVVVTCSVVHYIRRHQELSTSTKRKKKEMEQTKKLEDALSTVERVNNILTYERDLAGALSKEYPSVVLLNFKKNSAVTVKYKGEIIIETSQMYNRQYQDLWEKEVFKFVLEEDLERLKKAVLMETVLKELEDKNEYNYSYRHKNQNNEIHYVQASFIRFHTYMSDESLIILGFRNIDSIVEKSNSFLCTLSKKIPCWPETNKEMNLDFVLYYYSIVLQSQTKIKLEFVF